MKMSCADSRLSFRVASGSNSLHFAHVDGGAARSLDLSYASPDRLLHGRLIAVLAARNCCCPEVSNRWVRQTLGRAWRRHRFVFTTPRRGLLRAVSWEP